MAIMYYNITTHECILFIVVNIFIKKVSVFVVTLTGNFTIKKEIINIGPPGFKCMRNYLFHKNINDDVLAVQYLYKSF